MPSPGTSLTEIFENRVSQLGDKVLYKFLLTDDLSHEVSYKDFYSKIVSYAATLQKINNLQKGERALILYPPGLDYISVFYACLLSGIIAVPAYPPAYKNVERITSIIKDCGPSVILTNAQIAEQLKVYFYHESIAPPKIVSLCNEPLVEPGYYEHQKFDRNTIAFLQYTSGSTADPKWKPGGGTSARSRPVPHRPSACPPSPSSSCWW